MPDQKPSMSSVDPEQPTSTSTPTPTSAGDRVRPRNRAVILPNLRTRRRYRNDPDVHPDIQLLDADSFKALISMLHPREMLLLSRGCRALTRGGHYRDCYRDELELQEPLLTDQPCPPANVPVARVRSISDMQQCLEQYLMWSWPAHEWIWLNCLPQDDPQGHASSCIRTILRIFRVSCNRMPRESFPSLLVICTALNAAFDHLLFDRLEIFKPRQTRRIVRTMPSRNRLPKRDMVLLARALSRRVPGLIREPVNRTTDLEPYIACMCTLTRLSSDLRSIILREDMLMTLANRVTCLSRELHPVQRTGHSAESVAIPEFVRHAAIGRMMSSECMVTWARICFRRITTNRPPLKRALNLGATLWLATNLRVLQKLELWIKEEWDVSEQNCDLNLFPHFARPGEVDDDLHTWFRPNYMRVYRRIRHMTLAAAHSGNVRVLEFLRIHCKRLWPEFDPMVPVLREVLQELLEGKVANHQRVVLYILKRGIMPRSRPPIDCWISSSQTLRSIVPILLTAAQTNHFQQYELPSSESIAADHADTIRMQLQSFNLRQRIATVLRAVCEGKRTLLTRLRQEPLVEGVFQILDNAKCMIDFDCDQKRYEDADVQRDRGRSSGVILTELIALERNNHPEINPDSSEHTGSERSSPNFDSAVSFGSEIYRDSSDHTGSEQSDASDDDSSDE